MNNLKIEFYNGKMVFYLDNFLPTSKVRLKKLFNVMMMAKEPKKVFNDFVKMAGFEVCALDLIGSARKEKLIDNISFMNDLYLKKFNQDNNVYVELFKLYFGGEK